MKRLFAVLAAFVICASFQYASAQQKSPKMDKNFDMVMSQQVAFFTRELNLTTDEAVKFWPVHNEFMQAQHKAHKETMKALKALEKAIRSTEIANAPERGEFKEGRPAPDKDMKQAPKKDFKPATDKEIDALAQKYMNALAAEKDVVATYYPQFKSVLPTAKAAKVFSTEEKFRNFIIKNLRKPGEGMPQAPHNGMMPQKEKENHGCEGMDFEECRR